MGFFAPTTFGAKPLPLVPRCGECGLSTSGCLSPKMPVYGRGRRKVLLLGEAPGRTEDDRGRPFVGKAGQHLRETLAGLGVDMDEDCWAYNSLICRPPNNRTPSDNQVTWCRPNVVRTIEELRPQVIVLLGGVAIKSVLRPLWKKEIGEVGRWLGFRIPLHAPNAWACPTYHPSHLVRSKESLNSSDRDRYPLRQRFFERHLREAFGLGDVPWPVLPLYEKRVRVVEDPAHAADLIHGMIRRGNPVAVDFETTTLKPDGPHAQIYSCAVSDGAMTVSYPWHGAAVRATRELVRSRQPKVAANLKFELRWCMAKLNTILENLWWDTVLSAHAMDNREATASVKFQSFVLRGVPNYADRVDPYLHSAGGNTPNRIRQAGLRQILLYGGLDALLELEIAYLQRKAMGLDSP